MREEGRYLYHERKKAEDKLKLLLAKGKRRYFIQPIKEALDSEGRPLTEELTSEKVAPAKLADSDAAESSDESDE